MPIKLSPAQDPQAFIGFAPTAMLIGDPPDARAIEVTAHPGGSVPAGFGPRGGYVALRFCGTRGGYTSQSAYLDLLPTAARRLAADLRGLVNTRAGIVSARFDPAATARDRYADSDGTFSAVPSGASAFRLVVLAPGAVPSKRVSQPPVFTDGPTLMRFAICLERAADVADGLLSASGQL